MEYTLLHLFENMILYNRIFSMKLWNNTVIESRAINESCFFNMNHMLKLGQQHYFEVNVLDSRCESCQRREVWHDGCVCVCVCVCINCDNYHQVIIKGILQKVAKASLPVANAMIRRSDSSIMLFATGNKAFAT